MKKKMKNHKTRSMTTAVAITMILMTILLAGCGKGGKMEGGFEKDALIAQAEADITTAESNDFQGWKARFQPDLQSVLTEEMYTQYLSYLESIGDFQKFGKAAVTTQEQNGVVYGVVVYLVEHEGGETKYTIIYDGDMNLVAFNT